MRDKFETAYGDKTPTPTQPQGEIKLYLERIEKALEIQYETISMLKVKIEPIICGEYPCGCGDQCSVDPETQIGAMLATVLSKITDRTEMIGNLVDRVRL